MSDKRRPDLAKPYKALPVAESEDDFFSTLSSMISFVAMFLRSKYAAWFALFAAVGCVANARPEKRSGSTMNIVIAFTAVLLVYLPILLPNNNLGGLNINAQRPVKA